MLKDLATNLILAILSTYVVYEYYNIFFEFKKAAIKNKCIIGSYIIWQILSLGVLLVFPVWVRVMLSVVFVVLISFCYVGDFWGKFIFAILYNAVWLLAEMLIGAFFLVIGLSIVKYEILGSVVSKLFLLIMVKMLQYFFKYSSINILSWKENAMLLLLPAGSMFLTYHIFMLSYKVGTEQDIIISLLAFVAILTINIMMFVIYKRLSDSLELKRENSIYQLEIDLYNEHIKEKENAMSEFRKSKHDLKHKLMFLHELVQDKKYDELEDYINELVDLKSLEGFTIAHSDNSLIDALVNYKYETAKKYGITFNVKLDIPISFPLANSDLCVILGNALDNAIEANVGTEISDPFIDLKMKYNQNNLIIILKNSFDGHIKIDDKGNVRTRKKDKENHGIGIVSIQKALQKYNGLMNVEIEDKTYKVTIIMHGKSE